MDYEPTSPLNVERLTTVQHIHMKAILKRFQSDDGIRIEYKSDGRIEYAEPDAPPFVAMRVWSQELEAHISHPIEDRFIKEVQRLVKGGEVNNHKALSQYHLLWDLRHYYALNPCVDTPVFPIECGSLPIEAEEWLEKRNKVGARAGGVIPARHMTTQNLKADLNLEGNVKAYEGVVWDVLRSPDAPLVSADTYGNCLLMVVDPHLALQGRFSKRAHPARTLSAASAEEMNRKSKAIAERFTFG